ncbi:hypothetical protein INR49_004474 [Caranx melampygus]|nr:hypothetical protein INR49_004474 [Caranx melampygus]
MDQGFTIGGVETPATETSRGALTHRRAEVFLSDHDVTTLTDLSRSCSSRLVNSSLFFMNSPWFLFSSSSLNSACLCDCSTINSCSSIRLYVSLCFSTNLSSCGGKMEKNCHICTAVSYLHHGLLIDVLLERFRLALDGVSLQSLKHLLWCDKTIFGLQQGQVDFLCLQHRDHLISGLQLDRKVESVRFDFLKCKFKLSRKTRSSLERSLPFSLLPPFVAPLALPLPPALVLFLAVLLFL